MLPVLYRWYAYFAVNGFLNRSLRCYHVLLVQRPPGLACGLHHHHIDGKPFSTLFMIGGVVQ
jgi:hypothetical protein